MNSNDYILNRFKQCKLRKRKKRIFSIFILIILILSLLITYSIKVVNPIIYEYSIAQIERLIVKASNSSIESVSNKYNYDDIVSINYDNEGNILFIKANQIKINKITNTISLYTQETLDKISKLGISIPIGTCSGISFLSGRGSNINININPIGNVISLLKSEFQEAGINQTTHKIFIDIKCEISVILPFAVKKVVKNVETLVSESLIVGKIPSIYLNTNNLTDFN